MKNMSGLNFKKKSQATCFDDVIKYLDADIRERLNKLSSDEKRSVQEIRLRTNQPIMLSTNNEDLFLDDQNKLHTNREKASLIVNKEAIFNSFQMCCNYSIYAYEEEIKQGFITLKSGHRVGIAGSVIYGMNGIETIKDINSLNYRISKEILGVSDEIMKHIICSKDSIYHTLIVSPPQCGKTTLLRDIIRNISNGFESLNFSGVKVGVVDERMEISGVHKGELQMNLGIRTDVLSSCPKYEGIMMLIRSMSPQVIATDELGNEKDIKAIHEALKAGVKLIATVHGTDIKDIMTKPYLKEILRENIFEKAILLDNSKGVGTIKKVVDLNKYKRESKEKYHVDNENFRLPDGSYIL